jgi:hypothetical protein
MIIASLLMAMQYCFCKFDFIIILSGLELNCLYLYKLEKIKARHYCLRLYDVPFFV